jgi:hypothetical protein
MAVVVYADIQLIMKSLAVTEPEDQLECSPKPDIGPHSQSVVSIRDN